MNLTTDRFTLRRTVLITGASGGIGGEAACAFAQAGDHVVLHGFRHIARAEALADELRRKGCDTHVCRADLTDGEQVHRMFCEIKSALGDVDVLVNNAGTAASGLLCDMTEKDFDFVVASNLKSMFLCCKEAYSGMVRKKSGRILNVSSIWGTAGASCEVIYSASKAGVIGFTKALAKELAPSGITVNAVAPGVIDTEMLKPYNEGERRTMRKETPLGRLGTPRDIADALFFLASEKASFITGQILGIDGGFGQ